MGDPRRIRNKYSGPMHPWQKQRIETEKPLMKSYGLSNKAELWKVGTKLKKYKDNAKNLVALKGAQAEKERAQLVDKLKSFNLIQSESLDEILGLNLEQLLDRRLQTLVYKKGLARSVKQARQMITHGHIKVNGKKMTAPGFLVTIKDEASITYSEKSRFNDPEHPERKMPETKAEAKKEAGTKKAKPTEKKEEKVKETSAEKVQESKEEKNE